MATIKYKSPHVPDFARARRVVSRIVTEEAESQVYAFAEREADIFRWAILRQDFQSFHELPLTLRYLSRKIAAHADVRVMIATQWYIDHIKVFKKRNADGTLTVYVGFHRNVHARDIKGKIVKILLREVAMIQEKGSAKANIPSRPHWKPHLEKMTARAPRVRKSIKRRVMQRIRKEVPAALGKGT